MVMSHFDYIGMFIRNFRQANNESLQALADRSGVSRSMIAQIESAQKSPTLAVLAKLAQAMISGRVPHMSYNIQNAKAA